MRKWIWIFGLTAAMAGCGTSVPLNDVPVSDANPKVVQPGDANGARAGSGAIATPAVKSVDLTGGTDVVAAAARAGNVVYFDYDSYIVKPEFQNLIAAQARAIKAQSGRHVIIEGHTDAMGGREYNLALGQRRADAVRDALGVFGVPANQMESVSYGKEKPAVQGTDEAAYAKNRRAVIRVQ
ncbi:MAG: peptidoglycan-associated lipoprotein Pal [Rhodoferax sp.]